jgi:predicted MFS family arabinose efflux permease
VIFARGLLGTVGPVLAAEKSTDHIAALASFATWTDIGLAAGAFFGIVGVVEIGYATSYALLAIMSAVAAVWYRQSTKPV